MCLLCFLSLFNRTCLQQQAPFQCHSGDLDHDRLAAGQCQFQRKSAVAQFRQDLAFRRMIRIEISILADRPLSAGIGVQPQRYTLGFNARICQEDRVPGMILPAAAPCRRTNGRQPDRSRELFIIAMAVVIVPVVSSVQYICTLMFATKSLSTTFNLKHTVLSFNSIEAPP